LTLLLCGCDMSTATVAGKVRYEGKRVAWGSVVAVAENSKEFQTTIQPDGTYSLAGVPFGMLHITVRQPPRKTGEKPHRPDKSEARFPIPNRYSKPDQSGLSVTVDSFATPYDIDLK
jgi:hypothetical protein